MEAKEKGLYEYNLLLVYHNKINTLWGGKGKAEILNKSFQKLFTVEKISWKKISLQGVGTEGHCCGSGRNKGSIGKTECGDGLRP